jgi:TetR/AcrR family transcriptional repressor of nem operon
MGRTSDARDRLIQAAKDLTYARGYTAVGVKDICEQAGVHKGSFYHFFPTKRDLLLAVIDAHVVWLRGVVTEAADPDRPPLERIRRLFHLVGDFDEELVRSTGKMSGCPFGNLAAELNTRDDVIREKIDGVFDEAAGFLEQQLIEARDAGDLKNIDPSAGARAILAYLEGLQLLAATRKSPGLVRGLADGALRLAELGGDGVSRDKVQTH